MLWVSSQLDLCLSKLLCVCVCEKISDSRSAADKSGCHPVPQLSVTSRTCVSAAGQSSLLNLLDTKGKRSCFQPLLSLCLTQAPVERFMNPF